MEPGDGGRGDPGPRLPHPHGLRRRGSTLSSGGRPTRVVLASCADLPEGDGDDDALLEALTAAGIDTRWRPWDRITPDDDVLVVLRATWDYTERPADLLAWVDALPHVANPAGAVRWSSHKRYLLDLAADGVPVVPSVLLEPGQDLPPFDGEVVLKPAVGAGSRAVGRFTDPRAAAAHVRHLHATGVAVVVQPFLASVDSAGETAVVLLGGEPSHAFHKSAMLAAPGGAARAADGSGLFVAEALRGHEPTARERALARRALDRAAARAGVRPADLLYARVDTLDGPDGPVVLEVELVEPSLGWRQLAAPQRAAALSTFVGGVRALLA